MIDCFTFYTEHLQQETGLGIGFIGMLEMLLVDKAVMYESSALNKKLNLLNVSSGYFLSFNSSSVQVQLLSVTLHGLMLWEKLVPVGAHLQADYCFKNWLQSSMMFSVGIL